MKFPHCVSSNIFAKKIGNTAHPLLMEENIILDVRSHKSHEKQKSSLYPINYIEGGLNLSLFFLLLLLLLKFEALEM